MAKHLLTGRNGERLAEIWLVEKGYRLLEVNWRFKNWEIDLIAEKHGILHFIEVKTRTSLLFGHPEESVDHHKIRHLVNASAEYLYLHPEWQRIQIDVLSILLKNGIPDFFLIEDVYE